MTTIISSEQESRVTQLDELGKTQAPAIETLPDGEKIDPEAAQNLGAAIVKLFSDFYKDK